MTMIDCGHSRHEEVDPLESLLTDVVPCVMQFLAMPRTIRLDDISGGGVQQVRDAGKTTLKIEDGHVDFQ